MNTQNAYQEWCKHATLDADLGVELAAMNKAQVEDAFYRNLAFGTGGLRGIIGAGTNRMNVYTVGKASQGLAHYIQNHFSDKEQKVAIGFDSRIKSEMFAQVAAAVFAANGIKVFLYPQLMPTPCVSFAVREIRCAAGVMITASHNPGEYNGYKVYGADGCQITTVAAEEILNEIENLNVFTDVKLSSFLEALATGQVEFISDEVYTTYVQQVKKQTALSNEPLDKSAPIVYSPLNGAGLKPVLRVLNESGYTNITVVKEQEQPDGYFPTCPYPNPEMKEAMTLGMEYGQRCEADLLLATDPDCDRVGIATRNHNGKLELLTGNETGMLLLDYICDRRMANGTMPKQPVMIKTIVTTDMAERIAAHYGVQTINVLTGFKFIGEQIGLLERQNRKDDYIFGFEESYGYLSGSYVRDKDAVNGTLLICDMFAYYKAKGISLWDRLNELYDEYGYCMNTLHSFEFHGETGYVRIQEIMERLRDKVEGIGCRKTLKCLDYAIGLNGLPKSNVLKFILENECSVVVRPSGTEPKLKIYLSLNAPSKEQAAALDKELTDALQHHYFDPVSQSSPI